MFKNFANNTEIMIQKFMIDTTVVAFTHCDSGGLKVVNHQFKVTSRNEIYMEKQK